MFTSSNDLYYNKANNTACYSIYDQNEIENDGDDSNNMKCQSKVIYFTDENDNNWINAISHKESDNVPNVESIENNYNDLSVHSDVNFDFVTEQFHKSNYNIYLYFAFIVLQIT